MNIDARRSDLRCRNSGRLRRSPHSRVNSQTSNSDTSTEDSRRSAGTPAQDRVVSGNSLLLHGRIQSTRLRFQTAARILGRYCRSDSILYLVRPSPSLSYPSVETRYCNCRRQSSARRAEWKGCLTPPHSDCRRTASPSFGIGGIRRWAASSASALHLR